MHRVLAESAVLPGYCLFNRKDGVHDADSQSPRYSCYEAGYGSGCAISSQRSVFFSGV